MFKTGPGDHRGVVGAQSRWRCDKVRVLRGAQIGKATAQRRVGGDAAGDDQRLRRLRVYVTEGVEGVAAPVGQHIADGRLKRRREIGDVARVERTGRQSVDGMAQGGLEAGERKIATRPPAHRPWQVEARAVATGSGGFECRAAGIAEFEQLGRLVEGFADGVVDGAAKAVIDADILCDHQLAVAAGDQQQEVGKVDCVGQPRGQGMPFEVVDGDKRFGVRRGDRLGGHHADDDAADQSRAACRGDAVEIAERDAGIGHGARDDAVEIVEVGARGDFRHDAAIRPVLVELRQHDVGQDRPVVANDRGGGFVAACFDAENDHCEDIARGHSPDQTNASGKGSVANNPTFRINGTKTLSNSLWRRYERDMTSIPLRIGTRGSPLALVQATMVRDLLTAAHPGELEPEIIVIRTTGDAVTDRPLADIGGKGLFTKEIEAALIDRRIDVAVHSLKDVETWLPDGLTIDCFLPRADPRDVLIGADSIAALPDGARIGTSSLRRAAQIRARRPDVTIVPFRGNVDTRIAKLAAGEADAMLLARAGLDRLGRNDVAGVTLDPSELLPAVAQGIVGLERRSDDSVTAARLAPLNDAAAAAAAAAERAMLAVLDGSCRTPIAGLALIAGDSLELEGLVAMPDGSRVHRAAATGHVDGAEALGRSVGAELRAKAGADFFKALV